MSGCDQLACYPGQPNHRLKRWFFDVTAWTGLYGKIWIYRLSLPKGVQEESQVKSLSAQAVNLVMLKTFSHRGVYS